MKKMTYTTSLGKVERNLDMEKESDQNQVTKAKDDFDAIHSFLQSWNEVKVEEDSIFSPKSSHSAFMGQLGALGKGTEL